MRKNLLGKTVTLRHPTETDMPYIRSLWADPDTMKEVGGPIELDEEKAQRWFKKLVDPGNPLDRYFLICDKDGQPLGEASFHRYDPKTKTAELNIKIEHRRRFGGHGPEAARLLLDYFFYEFGGEVLEDPVAAGNRSGQRALARLGFVRVGATEDAVILRMDRKRFNQLSGGSRAPSTSPEYG